MSQECLIIFSRYPEPGKTKTRMIPTLGAEGAAKLQKEMTEHTLSQGQQLQKHQNTALEVHFAGGNIELMQDWLGQEVVFRLQEAGDLGQRMQSAFAGAMSQRMQRVLMIGIDCPGVNEQILAQGFEILRDKDLVLGPAEDGGYYLIGLSRLIPELFVGIDWGTGEVLQQTLKIVEQLSISVGMLPILNDVDRPEDLPIWEQFKSTEDIS